MQKKTCLLFAYCTAFCILFILDFDNRGSCSKRVIHSVMGPEEKVSGAGSSKTSLFESKCTVYQSIGYSVDNTSWQAKNMRKIA